jgi:hypothetical protein
MKIIRIVFFAGLLAGLLLIQYLIWQSDSLTAQQKLVSSLFAWIIPCIWIYIILSIEGTIKSDLKVKEKCVFSHFTFALN